MCGECQAVCPQNAQLAAAGGRRVDFARCAACGACAARCPSGALRLAGRWMTPQETLEAVLRDRPFYGQKGGVTFSGGECSRQPEFLLETLALCREAGLHTAVDTCGLMPEATLDALAARTDLFLYDIKAVTPGVHRAGTGADNARILQNYRRLMQKGCRVWVRVPVIGGFNASAEEMAGIAAFLKENAGAEQIELMPYHKLGRGKYAQIGMPTPDDGGRAVSHARMEEYYRIFQRLDLPVQGAKRTETP